MLKKEKKKIKTGRQILEIVAFMNKKILLWAIPGKCHEFTSRKFQGFPPNKHTSFLAAQYTITVNQHNNSKSPQ